MVYGIIFTSNYRILRPMDSTLPATRDPVSPAPADHATAHSSRSRTGRDLRILHIALYALSALCLTAAGYCSYVAVSLAPVTYGASTLAFIPAIVLVAASIGLYWAARVTGLADTWFNNPSQDHNRDFEPVGGLV